MLFRLRYDKGDISELEIAQLESDYWYTKSQIPYLEKNLHSLKYYKRSGRKESGSRKITEYS